MSVYIAWSIVILVSRKLEFTRSRVIELYQYLSRLH